MPWIIFPPLREFCQLFIFYGGNFIPESPLLGSNTICSLKKGGKIGSSPGMSILISIHETLFNLLIETAQKFYTENLICLKNLRKAKNFIPLKAMNEISFFLTIWNTSSLIYNIQCLHKNFNLINKMLRWKFSWEHIWTYH